MPVVISTVELLEFVGIFWFRGPRRRWRFCRWGGEHGATVEAAVTTIDQSDIRGSSSVLAGMVVIRRELPLTRDAGSGLSPTA